MLNKYTFFLFLSANILLVKPVYTQSKTTVKTPTVIPAKKEDEKKYTRWSLKGGGNISVIYLARNIKETNNEPGFCGGLTYDLNNFVRISSLHTRFRPINIEPTWLNVKANTYEINLEILAKFPNNKTLLYPFAGLSYNTYTGFFTGESDYLNLREYYPVNSTVKNQWLGLNFGVGLEHNFGLLGIFIDYRMRVGKQDKIINIMDVCYTGGLKVCIPYIKRKVNYAAKNARFLD